MIEHFSDPYSDELLYSVWARNSDDVRYPTRQDVLQELFGTITARPIVDLPCHLGYFISNLPTGHLYTLDRLIDCHTLFPFYSLFLPLERSNSIRAQMINSDGTAIHLRRGTASNLSLSRLRYCPICTMEERKNLGECYWHRLHQIAGVVICPIHMVYLENSEVRIPFLSNAFISAERILETSYPRAVKSSPWRDIFLAIATSARYLLYHSV
jgi:TniQ